MIYAQIKDGIVMNCIVVDDIMLLHVFEHGFDSIIRIDNISPQPGIGWEYDGSTFIAPVIPEEESEV